MKPVPQEVRSRGLGFEFLYTRWKAEDGGNIYKQRMARAMNHEIIYRCGRENHSNFVRGRLKGNQND